MTIKKLFLVPGLLLLITAVAAFGQTATSVLSGTIHDETGAVVAGANVVVRNEATGATNLGDSYYHGGTLEAEKRFSHGVSFHGSYTFSKAITDVDSVTNLADIPEGTTVRSERSLSRQHVGHRFTMAVLGQFGKSVPVIHDFKLSSVITAESGRPFNVFSGADSNGDGNPNSDRPGLLGRNTLIGPKYASVDFRVSRAIKVTERVSSEFSLDFFNLFNRVNIRDLNTVYGGINLSLPPIASFNTPRDVFNPRQLQFEAKVRF
ncbi:MAG TPA: hypothetical protein VKM94_16705 [Blastocatellia bacterium]|nr:hypothetical protein [Blastocatellia bacterium]